MNNAILVTGPTASGKSALALGLAQALGGSIINADAMQVYEDLRVLTDRPNCAELSLAHHALYGVRRASLGASVAWWRAEAVAAMQYAQSLGLIPILCGGTGLYFHALRTGLAPIPDPGVAARSEAQGLLAELGPQGLYRRLAQVDPETAARLHPGDSQRLVRAYEVWLGTGRGLVDWWSATKKEFGPAGWRFYAVLVDPPPLELRGAVADRFSSMLRAGAVAEVAGLLGQGLDQGLPAMRALGVPQLAAYIRGKCSLKEASDQAIAATIAFTKRQRTWFRNHQLTEPSATHMIHARIASLEQFSVSLLQNLVIFVQSWLDAPQQKR